MDSSVLLDLLGNENRRRILRLLSHKPCYVTEISEYLGVSPKAVIDHLRKLEEAGLIESRTDDQRRKYFHISQSLRLEVNVSPYGFGTKSAYPASPSLDMDGRCPHLSINLRGEATSAEDCDGIAADGDGEADVPNLAREFHRLQDLENELSLAQRWVHGRITDVLDSLTEYIGAEADSRFYAEVVAAVVATDGSVPAVAEEVNASPTTVQEVLHQLADRGIVVRDSSGWQVV